MSEDYGKMTHEYQEIDALPEALAAEIAARQAIGSSLETVKNYAVMYAEPFKAADYEQGGIGSGGAKADSVKFIRTKDYVDKRVRFVAAESGQLYVKMYKNDAFVGNLEPDGTLNATNHHPFTGFVNLSQVYAMDPDYQIKFVYTYAAETSPADIVRVIPYTNIPQILTGKKISIYGDSISTYTGFIPSGNAVYYNGNNAGVSSVAQTWWYRTIAALNGTLLVDQSWSGRCVSNKRDSESGMTNSGAWRQTEVDKLAADGSIPDIIMIKLGINDFNHNVQEGTYDGSTSLPDPNTAPTTFREAYAIMLHRIMTTYPLAKVYCCILNQCERSGDPGFPEINASGSAISDFNAAIRELAAAFGAGIIDHGSAGMTYYNLSTYAGDYSSQTGDGLHPNAAGMRLLANKTVSALVADTAF